ncbi:phosphate ABC transporter permease subunit PstC, partial [Candidatus Thorarchaeota archaeon]
MQNETTQTEAYVDGDTPFEEAEKSIDFLTVALALMGYLVGGVIGLFYVWFFLGWSGVVLSQLLGGIMGLLVAVYRQHIRQSIHNIYIEIRTTKGAGRIDLAGRMALIIPAFASIFTIVLILTLLLAESAPILTNPEFGPIIYLQTAWKHDDELFGILVFMIGSFFTSGIAIGLAVPLGVGGAILLSEFAPHAMRSALRMVIEMMAAIPSIVYGLWAFTVLRFWVAALSTETSNGLSLLSGGLILAIMLLPTVVTVSEDALQAVPNSLREASLALGASRSETARKIVLSAALPGVGAAVVLSLGRAIGETMAILLVTGNSAVIPFSLFDPCYVMTSVIANQL